MPLQKPEKCPTCGSSDFWLRTTWGSPEWVCSTCHPKPGERKEKDEGNTCKTK